MGSKFELEHEQDQEENTAGSPFSCDEEDYGPSPRKKRKVTQNKRVVTIPIDGGAGRGEVYPPPDNWSWRKYGQKPIKGSPYPRGYYRCSSSKDCPARKQVERSRLDPTTLLITYSCDHNHPRPAKNHRDHQSHPPPKPAPAKNHRDHQSHPPPKPAPSSPTPNKECVAIVGHLDIEPAFAELAGELGWLCNVGSTVMDGMTFVGPDPWTYRELEVFMPIGEEDKLLFGDLGDLPESSVVFRQAPCCSGVV